MRLWISIITHFCTLLLISKTFQQPAIILIIVQIRVYHFKWFGFRFEGIMEMLWMVWRICYTFWFGFELLGQVESEEKLMTSLQHYWIADEPINVLTFLELIW